MHMLFQHKASDEQEHEDHQPPVPPIKSDQKRHKKDQQNLKAQIPPGIDLHLRPKEMSQPEEIHSGIDQINRKSITVAGCMCQVSYPHAEQKWQGKRKHKFHIPFQNKQCCLMSCKLIFMILGFHRQSKTIH